MPLAAGRSDTAVAFPWSTIMSDIHRRTTLLVTAVDELFGTHRRLRHRGCDALTYGGGFHQGERQSEGLERASRLNVDRHGEGAASACCWP